MAGSTTTTYVSLARVRLVAKRVQTATKESKWEMPEELTKLKDTVEKEAHAQSVAAGTYVSPFPDTPRYALTPAAERGSSAVLVTHHLSKLRSKAQPSLLPRQRRRHALASMGRSPRARTCRRTR